MPKFFSIPGVSSHRNSDDRRPAGSGRVRQQPQLGHEVGFAGDEPRMESRTVFDNMRSETLDGRIVGGTGAPLYDRQVFEGSYNPGLDESDGISYLGDRLEKVADIHDRSKGSTRTIYKRFGQDGRYSGEVKVDHDQTDKGDVIARTGRNLD